MVYLHLSSEASVGLEFPIVGFRNLSLCFWVGNIGRRRSGVGGGRHDADRMGERERGFLISVLVLGNGSNLAFDA